MYVHGGPEGCNPVWMSRIEIATDSRQTPILCRRHVKPVTAFFENSTKPAFLAKRSGEG
jgi:hypothetical protein